LARFFGQNTFLGSRWTRPLLSADFLPLGTLGCGTQPSPVLDFIEQKPARDIAIEALLAGALAFNPNSGGPMEQHHAGGGLVYVLAAVAAGPDEALLDVSFMHPQRGHLLRQLSLLLRVHREYAHHEISRYSPLRIASRRR
jgi:hypothetical protein